MGLEDELTQAEVSMYESARRVPGLLVLREHAKLAGMWMDVLVGDELDLPKRKRGGVPLSHPWRDFAYSEKSIAARRVLPVAEVKKGTSLLGREKGTSLLGVYTPLPFC